MASCVAPVTPSKTEIGLEAGPKCDSWIDCPEKYIHLSMGWGTWAVTILYNLEEFTVWHFDDPRSSLLSAVRQSPPDPVRHRRWQTAVALQTLPLSVHSP